MVMMNTITPTFTTEIEGGVWAKDRNVTEEADVFCGLC